jgi:hypothetical protein
MLSGRFEKEEEKGVQYCHHCEAISFGFLSTPICNAKSLPVCDFKHKKTQEAIWPGFNPNGVKHRLW